MTTKVQGTNGIEFPDGSVQGSAAYSKAEFGETSGSAANKVVRFADGTQIAYYNDVRTDVAVADPYGSLFTGLCSVNFALPFISTPAISCGIFCALNQAGWGNVSPGATASGCTLRGFDTASRPIGTTFYISMIAVGRWK